jgi:hypothetical protein
VAGVVRAADDKIPVAGITVRIAGDATVFLGDMALAQVSTDANGRFEVTLPKGAAWLTAWPRRPLVRNAPVAIDLTRPAAELRQLEILLQRK